MLASCTSNPLGPDSIPQRLHAGQQGSGQLRELASILDEVEHDAAGTLLAGSTPGRRPREAWPVSPIDGTQVADGRRAGRALAPGARLGRAARRSPRRLGLRGARERRPPGRSRLASRQSGSRARWAGSSSSTPTAVPSRSTSRGSTAAPRPRSIAPWRPRVRLLELGGLQPYLAPKAAWWRREQPEVYERARRMVMAGGLYRAPSRRLERRRCRRSIARPRGSSALYDVRDRRGCRASSASSGTFRPRLAPEGRSCRGGRSVASAARRRDAQRSPEGVPLVGGARRRPLPAGLAPVPSTRASPWTRRGRRITSASAASASPPTPRGRC